MGTAENPHAGQGMVVLDIGGDIGALIVHAPSSLADVEIEIAPHGSRSLTPDEGVGWWIGQWRSGHSVHDHDHDHHHDHDHDKDHDHDHPPGPAWPHVAVVGRPHGDRLAYAAVYPGLRAGSYDLWVMGTDAPIMTATVSGAQVSELEWPTA